uniref:phage regulatory CII family protein n=1 Tax=Achromobacter sp. GbtcB20 TaxID=2824765 RepID=UPI00353016D5
MNHLDAFHQTVHGAPGGCEAIAPRMGMSAAILRNKANPNSTTNKPTLDEADRLMG